MQTKQKGFTIIELIVVIAIIAVLATIVAINVTSYIAKGKDASIQGNLANIITNAAVIFDASNTYTGLCAKPTVKAAIDAIDTTIGGTAGAATDCYATADAWAACAELISNTDQYYCVDSTGTKKLVTGTCGAFTTMSVCPS